MAASFLAGATERETRLMTRFLRREKTSSSAPEVGSGSGFVSLMNRSEKAKQLVFAFLGSQRGGPLFICLGGSVQLVVNSRL